MFDLNKRENLTKEEQLAIIAEVEKNFLKFWDKDFNPEVFKEYRNNFVFTKDIQSQQILKQNLSKKPRFTIATPTYKRVDELKRALDSALNQDIDEEYEILIVENTDANERTKVQEILEKEYKGKLNYYKNPSNLGHFGNWNRCLELSQGEWICLLHSDDMITPNYLSEMKKVVEDERYKDATLIGCIDHNENIFPPNDLSKTRKRIDYFFQKTFLSKEKLESLEMTNLQWRKQSRELIFVPPGSILHNRQKCVALGGYNSDEYPTGDQTFVNRANLNGKVFTYRKKILQIATTEVAISDSPKCQLEFALLDPQIFRAFVTNKNTLRIMQYEQIKMYQQILRQKGCFVFDDYLDNLMKKNDIYESTTSTIYKKIFYPFRQPRKFFKMITLQNKS